MLFPLFDRNCDLIAWIDSSRHIFDADMNWIAYISSNNAWSSGSGNWIGSVNGLVCLDTYGKVFAWSNNSRVDGTARPARPARAARAARPARPARPAKPARPAQPATVVTLPAYTDRDINIHDLQYANRENAG